MISVGFVLAASLLLQTESQTVVYDRPIDDGHRLRVTMTNTASASSVVVTLVRRTAAVETWDIATIANPNGESFQVERADSQSVVMSRQTSSYGIDAGSTKLFFDLPSKRLLKRIDFETSQDLVFANDIEAQRTLQVTRAGLDVLRERRLLAAKYHNYLAALPEIFARHPLPQSAYAEFARARPARIKDGYGPKYTAIEERVGAYQMVGTRWWFGKAFYDGEGTTGVGAIGWLDTNGSYTLLRVPELFDWSVSGLLVEDDTIWAGRVNYPEGGTNSGGLLQYDLKTQRVTLLPISDPIHVIARVEGALFVGTTHGLYVIRAGKQTRYRVEPDLSGQFIIVEEALPAS